MEKQMHTLDLVQFRSLFPISACLSIGNDVCLIDVRYDKSLSVLEYPCRFDGFLAFFCASGHIKVMINLVEFDVVENSLFVYMPGNIISVTEVDEKCRDSLEFTVIAMTADYMESLNVNTARLAEKRMRLQACPFFFMRDDERMIAKRYVTLAAEILRSGLTYKRESVSLLLSSFFSLAGGVMEERTAGFHLAAPTATDRGKAVFERFLAAVSEYYMDERSVSFYAGILCLTPKYLSRLVKSATGKSAPEWIDDYVILEAKNMLKYSDIQIKEIASRLHFPDSATFHKFFRKRTGMTPGAYRKL